MRSISMSRVENTRKEMLETVENKGLTHEQKVFQMASLADSLLEVLNVTDGLQELMDKKIICDLFEGHAPMRPRYIVPNYTLLFEKGCDFLKLDPPTDLYEALNTLLIFYKNVPSVTNFPVYIGNLDTLLEPFVIDMDYNIAKKAIKLFLIHIDRTITDSFCHANIGPNATISGKMILEVERELQNAVPNLTIKYNPDITPDDFAREAILTQLLVAKPSFANDKMFTKELSSNYSISSCYNGLIIGGGSYTLSRLLLGHLADASASREDFFNTQLPHSLTVMTNYMDERIRYMVEDSGFFESNFLSQEGFISKDKFTAMLGMVGLAECVNSLLEKEGSTKRYGNSEEADELGLDIIKAIDLFNKNHFSKYCFGTENHFLLHGQVGIDTDKDQTANCRIPIGEEPLELSDHMMHLAKFHPYFPSGIGEVFPMDSTVTKNPDYELDIIKGAFSQGVRYLSMHNSDSDVIRVTGYLVKRSEMDKLSRGESVLHDTTKLGLGSAINNKILERKIRK